MLLAAVAKQTGLETELEARALFHIYTKFLCMHVTKSEEKNLALILIDMFWLIEVACPLRSISPCARSQSFLQWR